MRLARRAGSRAAAALLPLGAALALTAGCGGPAPIRIGAVFPLGGPAGPLSREELAGVEIARDLVDQDGGVAGRPIELSTADVERDTQAAPAVDGLRDQGVPAIIGAYSSSLSIPASASAAADGLVYWEAGAVADQVTGRGLPLVFRVGATGSNLGDNSGDFAANTLVPMLGRPPGQVTVSLVVADDDYAHSVADAALARVRAAGMSVVSSSVFDPAHPDFAPVVADLRAARPDILILSSHLPDGVAFRRAMLAADVHVEAMIGSTMAQCEPEFGAMLGADAVGVFASDRPGEGFDPATLPAAGRALFARLAAAWKQRSGEAAPTEEVLSGFSAAWALFHDVLPRAAAAGRLDAQGIAAAARATHLAAGSLANGAGVEFAGSGPRLGQNLLAAAVVWQWQAVRHSVVVWPAEYATGRVTMVPLPR